METCWYVVKVLPGKERKLCDSFNKEISLGNIKYIERFICPLEKEFVVLRKKKVLREKVLYSGYLYFETLRKLEDDELKVIAGIQDIMAMGGDRRPLILNKLDIKRILKHETLDAHIDAKINKFKVGTEVKITEGPFNTFVGVISEIKGEKVVIEVKIFGRNNNVELTLSQIEVNNE
jgi:transcriptional antiterminator NusG